MSFLQTAPKPPGTKAGFPGLPLRAQGRGASPRSQAGKLLPGRSAPARRGAGEDAARHCHLVAGSGIAADRSQQPAQDSSLGPGGRARPQERAGRVGAGAERAGTGHVG